MQGTSRRQNEVQKGTSVVNHCMYVEKRSQQRVDRRKRQGD